MRKCLKFFLALLVLVLPSHGLNLSQRQALKNHLKATRFTTQEKTQQEWRPPTISPHHFSSLMSENSLHKEQQENDLIKALPGQPKDVAFKQYSGYVTVDAKTGRKLFYYLAEAVHEPSNKPLILWLNGGPGCSSLGYGAFQELGPFRVNADGKTLHENPYAWNQVTNMVFLESPIGVGFSYSNTSSDYNDGGDQITAKYNYIFLLNWFQRYPQYKHRDFYIAGESYAGNYIPELVDLILKYNSSRTSFMRLRGVLIGNGVINDNTDSKGYIEYLWSHALLSDETYEGVIKNCDFSSINASTTQLCAKFSIIADYEYGKIDPYNIYAPLCTHDQFMNSTMEMKGNGLDGIYDPCSYIYVESYFNTPDVQQAMHAELQNGENYSLCGDIVYMDRAETVLPIYTKMLAAGLRVLVYSGDVDSVVPITGTRLSINAMKLNIQTSWYAWMNGEDDVAGYSVIYKGGLTFASVRGAGHEVPSYQPARALTMVKYFVAFQSLPSAN